MYILSRESIVVLTYLSETNTTDPRPRTCERNSDQSQRREIMLKVLFNSLINSVDDFSSNWDGNESNAQPWLRVRSSECNMLTANHGNKKWCPNHGGYKHVTWTEMKFYKFDVWIFCTGNWNLSHVAVLKIHKNNLSGSNSTNTSNKAEYWRKKFTFSHL